MFAAPNQLSQGPGRPQAPPPQQPPPMGLGAGLELRDALAENTENFCASFVSWHAGHSGSAPPMTSFSKLLLHCSQTYSNMGIGTLYRIAGMS